jgi:hypothetical protein
MSPGEDWIFGDTEAATAERAAPARVRERSRRRRPFARLLLFALWLISFVIGTTALALFATGLVRDGSFGDAQLPIDLSQRGDWRSVQFRPYVPGRYLLYLTSVDREDRAEEVSYGGRIYVRIENSRRQVQLSERYEPPALSHHLRGGVQWTRVASIHINDFSFDPWTLSARVAAPEAAFARARSSMVLVRDRYNPGLAGLVNYVASAPALAFLLLSLVMAAGLPPRGGTWVPAVLSTVALLAIASLLAMSASAPLSS